MRNPARAGFTARATAGGKSDRQPFLERGDRVVGAGFAELIGGEVVAASPTHSSPAAWAAAASWGVSSPRTIASFGLSGSP